jgi:antitoxin (DNA-binding transcriptional repressor) of toxin-antitoxin stability system
MEACTETHIARETAMQNQPDRTSQRVVAVDDDPGLRQIVDEVVRTGEILVTRGGLPVARIIPIAAPLRSPRRPGSARGMFRMAEDFDAMPEELNEYF